MTLPLYIYFSSGSIQGQEEGGLQLISYPVHFIRVTIYPAAEPHNIKTEVTFYPGGGVGGSLLQIFQTINFIRIFIPRSYHTTLADVTINPR